MKLKILYFAKIRDCVGIDEEMPVIPAHIHTIAALMPWLAERHPGLKQAFADLGQICVARNQEYVKLDAPLDGAQEIAFFPPVTGG